MKVYTSYYARYKGTLGVQVSNSKPKTYEVYKVLTALSPDWEMVEKWKSNKSQEVWDEFVERYWKKLDGIGAHRILCLLQDGDVLLCWCKVYEECHRSILANWLQCHGVDVEEV